MAFLTFVQKLGLAGGALGLVFISWFGFKTTNGAHTASALQGIRIGVALLPALMLIPSIALMWNFSLSERRQRILRLRLNRRDRAIQAAGVPL
jgi:Na+/melibiose symporter-like transporter